MSIAVHHPLAVDEFLFDSGPAVPHGPQTHAVPDDAELRDFARLGHECWTQVDTALHDALSEVGIRLALPRAMLHASAEDGASACCTLHNIGSLVAAVVSATNREHDLGLVSNQHNLASARVHVGVHDAAERGSKQTSAVYHDVGMARGVEAGGFRDVGEDATLEYHTGFYALADQPGQVDGCVDAYRGEVGASVAALWEFAFGQDTKLIRVSMSASMKHMNKRHHVKLPTLGTTSLNHASSFVSSSNH